MLASQVQLPKVDTMVGERKGASAGEATAEKVSYRVMTPGLEVWVCRALLITSGVERLVGHFLLERGQVEVGR